MRKYYQIILLSFLVCIGGASSLWAQAATTTTASGTVPYQSTHYKIEADAQVSSADVQTLLNQLEANYALFAQWFADATQKIQPMLNVRYFKDQTTYNQALTDPSMANRSDFVYLDYGKPETNILYVYPVSDANMFMSMLARHSFFSYAFNAAPSLPTWLREGLALYFESINYDKDGKAVVPRNGIYLDNLKAVSKRSNLPMATLLAFSDDSGTFEKQEFERNLLYSWGLVNYMANNTDAVLNTLLLDAIKLATPIKTQDQATTDITTLINTTKASLQDDFNAYLTNTKSYLEWMYVAKDSYEKRDYVEANKAVQAAMLMRSDLYTPYYYLGLLAFEQKDYAQARSYYDEAIAKKAPEPLMNFAMGLLNYYGEKNYAEAERLLKAAKEADGVRYGKEVDKILVRLNTDQESDTQKPATQSANGQAAVTNSTKG